MDDPYADPSELRRSLAYIRRINALLGYNRSILGYFERFSRNWTPGRPVHVLDVATGSGDLPRAIDAWSRRRGFDVRVTGLDLHATTLRVAAELTPSAQFPRLRFVRGDALRLPFGDGSFDYATSALFLHHLDDADAVAALREMARVARRGVVVADLLRHRRAYAWITLFTLLSRPMVRHDARASVAQAFTRDEVLGLRQRAGIDFARYQRHFGHRFVLAGER
jgi:2-polyprenyl-3-methyl-5-hydroxy-6-metoxy-1,4-benzoquinol methylase